MDNIVHLDLGHDPATYHFANEAHAHLAREVSVATIEAPDELFALLSMSLARLGSRTIRIDSRASVAAKTAGPTPVQIEWGPWASRGSNLSCGHEERTTGHKTSRRPVASSIAGTARGERAADAVQECRVAQLQWLYY